MCLGGLPAGSLRRWFCFQAEPGLPSPGAPEIDPYSKIVGSVLEAIKKPLSFDPHLILRNCLECLVIQKSERVWFAFTSKEIPIFQAHSHSLPLLMYACFRAPVTNEIQKDERLNGSGNFQPHIFLRPSVVQMGRLRTRVVGVIPGRERLLRSQRRGPLPGPQLNLRAEYPSLILQPGKAGCMPVSFLSPQRMTSSAGRKYCNFSFYLLLTHPF